MEKELKELTEKINSSMENLQKGIDENKESSKEIHDLKEQIKTLGEQSEFQKKMQEQLNSIEVTNKKLSEMAEKNEQPVNDIKEALDSDEYQKNNQVGGFNHKFNVKTTITTSNSFTETNSKIIPSWRDTLIGGQPQQGLPVQALFNSGTVAESDYVDWFERTTLTDQSGWKAEAATSVESSLAWTSYKVPVEDVKTHFTVSKRKLADTNWMMSQIQGNLMYLLKAQLEDNVIDGTGSSNQLFGLIGASYAKTFNAPAAFEGTIPFANYIDVLKVAAAQVDIADSGTSDLYGGFSCTAHIVGKADYHFMTMLKDENGLPLIGLDGVLRVNGVPVYKSGFITAGTFLSGDFTKSTLWQREGISIEIYDQTASNALTGLVTVLATGRFALETQVAHRFGYVTGTFTTGVSEIDGGGQ